MDWIKEIGPNGGGDGGWRNDLPLSHDLPDKLVVDCQKLGLPIHPMFAVRLRVFIEWHRDKGREVEVVVPADPNAASVFRAMAIDPLEAGGDHDNDAILPVTRLRDDHAVEDVSRQTKEILEYQLTDVSGLGEAAFMAVAELCDNALDHGRNALGAYVAVRRFSEPRQQVAIAISDLGMGIPEHIRQKYPEWDDDGYAIARATEEHVTGTGNPHRGIGFSEVLEAALTRSLHAARMDIHSANGFCRIQTVQEQRKQEVFPAARFRRGTWITYDLISV
ncbi:MAG TPA: ATP-binding protein [Solirubrobacterales bacterium]|nr:ATP-binding protein [Solirubrobacterales bacterium]